LPQKKKTMFGCLALISPPPWPVRATVVVPEPASLLADTSYARPALLAQASDVRYSLLRLDAALYDPATLRRWRDLCQRLYMRPELRNFCIEKSIQLRRILDMEVSDAKLRRLRRERGSSIRELACRASMSTETIYSLEHGRREWAWPRTVRKLAEALQVKPKQLVKVEEE
jgi:DNA-binding XRE family transcriptional regulator